MNTETTLAIFKMSRKIPTSNDLFIICNGVEINAKIFLKFFVESPSKPEDDLVGSENTMLRNSGIVKGVQKKVCLTCVIN